MKKNNSKLVTANIITAVVISLVAIIFTVLVSKVDVAPVGSEQVSVGFSKLNAVFYNAIGYNELLYKVSEVFGYLSFLICGFFAFQGVMQLIKKKSLKKVNPRIYAIAGMYVAMLIVYILFEKVVINYRPLIIDSAEGLEASYPSSHTILSLGICLSGLVTYPYFIRNKTTRLIVNVLTIVDLVGVLLCRLLSGVHWITDILGGIFIASALFAIYVTVINMINTAGAGEAKKK